MITGNSSVLEGISNCGKNYATNNYYTKLFFFYSNKEKPAKKLVLIFKDKGAKVKNDIHY